MSSLEVQSSIATGELLDVNYTVMNVGSGPSFERQWTDFVVRQHAFKSRLSLSNILCLFCRTLCHQVMEWVQQIIIDNTVN